MVFLSTLLNVINLNRCVKYVFNKNVEAYLTFELSSYMRDSLSIQIVLIF